MFDIGFFEILIIAIVALVVLGPEKMPHAVRMCAAYWGHIKRRLIATQLKLEDQLALQDIKRQIEQEHINVQANIQTLIDQPPSTDDTLQEKTTPRPDQD